MANITATEARRQLYRLVDQVQQSHEPIQITGKRGNAVLVGEDDWLAVQETLHLVVDPRDARVDHRGHGHACR